MNEEIRVKQLTDESVEYIVDRHFLSNRRIFLFGDIDEESANHVIKQLRYMSDRSKDPIYLYISSVGGSVDDGLAIIDEMAGCQRRGVQVHTVAMGKAYSMAADILILGSPECRWATNNTSIMLHPIAYELPHDYKHYQEQTVKFESRRTDLLKKMVIKACLGVTKGKKFDNFSNSINNSLWVTATEAKKYGMIDGIWDYQWEDDEIINDDK